MAPREAENLTGQRFGSLIVLAPVNPRISKTFQSLCLCDCGNEIIRDNGNIKRRTTQNCGDRRKHLSPAPVGQRFGKLIVIAEAEPLKLKSGTLARKLLCRCDCGIEKSITKYCLEKGKILSCGCFGNKFKFQIKHKVGDKNGYLEIISINDDSYLCQCFCGSPPILLTFIQIRYKTHCGCLREHLDAATMRKLHAASRSSTRIKHNRSRSRSYQCWSQLKRKRRTLFCEVWLDPANFCAWYDEQLLICPNGKLERIDKTKPYGPDNCHLRDRVADTIQASKINRPKKPAKAKVLF
jgi:hypothetical protein